MAEDKSGLTNMPASSAFAVTPSDTVDCEAETRALWVGGAGNISVMMVNQSASTPTLFSGIAAGTLLPIRVKRVMSTLTTATLITGLY